LSRNGPSRSGADQQDSRRIETPWRQSAASEVRDIAPRWQAKRARRGRLHPLNVEIREVTWHHGENNLTIWFHKADGKWIEVHRMTWDKNAEF